MYFIKPILGIHQKYIGFYLMAFITRETNYGAGLDKVFTFPIFERAELLTC